MTTGDGMVSGRGDPNRRAGRGAIGLREADAIKGIAILLMFAHHLFGLPGLIRPENAVVPLVPGVPVEYWIGRFGKICVPVFLFLSGYGFAVRAALPRELEPGYFRRKALRFLGTYAFYFAVAVLVGNLFFQAVQRSGEPLYPNEPIPLILGALTLRVDFAYEWWFAETYLLLVLLTAPLLRVARRPALLILLAFAAFGLGAVLDTARIKPPLVSVSNLLIWQLPFVCGILACRIDAVGRLDELLGARGSALAVAAFAAAFAVVERLAPAAMTPFLILAGPPVALVLHRLVRGDGGWGGAKGVLVALGGLTLPLWLIHPFFCYYFFQDLTFAPRLSVPVFLALTLLTVASAMALEFARRSLRETARILRPQAN